MQLRPSIRLLSTLLLPVPLILAGCSTFGGKEEASSIKPIDFSRFPQDETQLVRRWEWQRSVYPRFGEDPAVLTPTTTDRTETLVFPTPDTVRVYRSDTLAQRTSRDAFFEGKKWGARDDTLATSTVFRDGPRKLYERVE